MKIEFKQVWSQWPEIDAYIDQNGVVCPCCNHVMIDATAVLEGTEAHCVAGDPEGEGMACAHGMHYDLNKAVAAEREACAKIADYYAKNSSTARFIADQIRARGKQ